MHVAMASQAGRGPTFCSLLSTAVTHESERSRVPPLWPTPAGKAIPLQSSSFLNLTPMGRAEARPYWHVRHADGLKHVPTVTQGQNHRLLLGISSIVNGVRICKYADSQYSGNDVERECTDGQGDDC